jgi:site-specific recombinase XerD
MIDGFLTSARRRGLRPASIYKRGRVVRAWCAYLDERGVSVEAATRFDVEGWLDTSRGAARHRYTLVSHLHMFYVWARRNDYATVDPTELVERPRLERRLPRPARAASVDVAIAEADPVMRAMLCLMADAGLRCCEVAALRWGDVDLAAGTIYVTGKGGRDRVVGIPSRLAIALAALDGIDGPVIGRRRSACRVSQLVGGYLRGAGVNATAHQLRHLYATRLYAATDGDLLSVQHALGHASVTSTQIYAAIDPGRAIALAQRLG